MNTFLAKTGSIKHGKTIKKCQKDVLKDKKNYP